MNIVHWGKYYPPDFGGIESVTSSLARGSVFHGDKVAVVCFAKKGSNYHLKCQREGVDVIRVESTLVLFSQPLNFYYLFILLKSSRGFGIIHLHAPNVLASLATLLIAKHQKLIVHWHSDIVRKGFLAWVLRPIELLMLHRADKIICTSRSYAEFSNSIRGYLSKVCVIPIGVPDSKMAHISPSQLNSLLLARISGRKIVLSVGRLVPYKGFEVLIDAAISMESNMVVVIVGVGPLEEDLKKRIADLHLDEKVILAGFQSPTALLEIFDLSTLFCLASVERSEAFGVVLVEAMCHGLPIVATNILGSGVSWVNQHNSTGLNVPVNDSFALAEACNKICNSPKDHARFSKNSRERYLCEFTEELFIFRINNLYKDLLNI